MDRWNGKTTIVTGASSGIGAVIAEFLVNYGLNVIGLARREERLRDLEKKLQGRKGKFFPLKVDITKEEDILNAFKWVTKNIGIVHILINNAGTIKSKGLTNGETEHWRETFETNVLGLCIATREAIKIMRTNEANGHIVHINSVVGHAVPYFPDANVYPASKFAVTALTETLRQELNSIGSKIKISSVSPGLVDNDTNDDFYKSAAILKSEDIAEAIIYILGTPSHVQIHELIIKPVGEG